MPEPGLALLGMPDGAVEADVELAVDVGDTELVDSTAVGSELERLGNGPGVVTVATIELAS
jgi:hypothetical protein